MVKKIYKNVTIGGLTTTGTFTSQIFIPFTPNYCKIKSVSYNWDNTINSNPSTDNIGLVKSSLINNETICSITRYDSVGAGYISNNMFDVKFTLSNQPISGNYDFTVYNLAGGISSEFGTLEIAITIEFGVKI